MSSEQVCPIRAHRQNVWTIAGKPAQQSGCMEVKCAWWTEIADGTGEVSEGCAITRLAISSIRLPVPNVTLTDYESVEAE